MFYILKYVVLLIYALISQAAAGERFVDFMSELLPPSNRIVSGSFSNTPTKSPNKRPQSTPHGHHKGI
jgi:hypothetical protein